MMSVEQYTWISIQSRVHETDGVYIYLFFIRQFIIYYDNMNFILEDGK